MKIDPVAIIIGFGLLSMTICLLVAIYFAFLEFVEWICFLYGVYFKRDREK